MTVVSTLRHLHHPDHYHLCNSNKRKWWPDQSDAQMNFLIEQIPLMEAEGLIEKCHNATGYTSLVVVKKPGSGPV